MRTMALLLLAIAALVPACGDDPAGGDDGGALDAAVHDGPVGVPDADPGPDAAGCGAMVAPVAMITGTEGLAIAADGTIYYSQPGHVGRWLPGAATAVDQWVALPGTSTVWGMAIAADGTLYVATPSNMPTTGKIWKIATGAVSPVAEELYSGAGRPNGLTLGPDGAIYYGDFAGGHVYRVTPAGVRTTVTTTVLGAPNGVLFDADGTLLVAQYNAGNVYRLTLDAAHVETGRVLAATVPGNGRPDGLARDDQGRYYVTDNSGGVVLRYDAAFASPTQLLTGVGAAANLAFGKGALGCTDLYVTSSGALRRIEAGVSGVP